MGIIGYLISLVVVGFVIGGLGRLIVPGPNPIGLWRTLGVGLAGAFIGGLLGGLLGLGAVSILFELAVSAGLVYLMSGRKLMSGRNQSLYSGRRR
ncbi:MAG: GlsB/YeaQ/YmgE family stress response membrane protein [Acidimicrobiales bacterium]